MQPVKILLVEDNRGDVYLLRQALADSGMPHTLNVVQDGAEAWELLKRSSTGGADQPEMILLDLNLPRVDGAELLQLIREAPELENTPVVLLSSSQSPQDQARAESLRYGLYLHKPFDLDEFLALGTQIRDFWERTGGRPQAGPAAAV
jgi:two-component system, chemotaxis family, response regulator Rcp1